MELWHRTCRWLRLNEDRNVPSPDRKLDGDTEKKDKAKSIDQGPAVEDLSPAEQRKYWAREQKRLRAVLLRLDTGGELELCPDPDSGNSVSFDGGFRARGDHRKVKRNMIKIP